MVNIADYVIKNNSCINLVGQISDVFRVFEVLQHLAVSLKGLNFLLVSFCVEIFFFIAFCGFLTCLQHLSCHLFTVFWYLGVVVIVA